MTLLFSQEEIEKYLYRDTMLVLAVSQDVTPDRPNSWRSLPYRRDLVLCCPEISKENPG